MAGSRPRLSGSGKRSCSGTFRRVLRPPQPPWPDLSRPSTLLFGCAEKEGVDARHKAGQGAIFGCLYRSRTIGFAEPDSSGSSPAMTIIWLWSKGSSAEWSIAGFGRVEGSAPAREGVAQGGGDLAADRRREKIADDQALAVRGDG